ncbi:MAG: hypothetical protein NUV60_03785 [Patescibacteria group bacterium]|nr:hypothetical protein [Patescibacteria group bacterium]
MSTAPMPIHSFLSSLISSVRSKPYGLSATLARKEQMQTFTLYLASLAVVI